MGGEKGKKERYRPMQGINFASCLCLSFPCFLYLRKCGKGEYLFYASLVSSDSRRKRKCRRRYISWPKKELQNAARNSPRTSVWQFRKYLKTAGGENFIFFPLSWYHCDLAFPSYFPPFLSKLGENKEVKQAKRENTLNCIWILLRDTCGEVREEHGGRQDIGPWLGISHMPPFQDFKCSSVR